MKFINYRLQTQIESLSTLKSNQFFKDYLKSILENQDKPYYQKADYVGLSIHELKSKIDYLSNNIKELQELKKKFSESLNIAKELTADILIDYGIDRIDGSIISSITLTKPSTKVNQSIEINNQDAVMELGYVKFEPDMKAIEKAIKTQDGLKELENYISISKIEVKTPAKVKINTKRINHIASSDEILIEHQKETA